MARNGNSKSFSRWTYVLTLALVSFILVCVLYFRWLYPYGHRVGCMPNLMGALSYYAREHNGWYPRDGKTPLQCLQVFYPDYLGDELAGLTGNRQAVSQRLRNGQPIDESISSWVYNPGLRLDDNPRLAIIWERTAGVTVNGHREEGHAVGFVNGEVKQIEAVQWTSFLQQQRELSSETFAKRRQP